MEDQQQKKYQLMTETPVSRLIPRMALPCVVSMLVTAFYNMADTFFVGMLKSNAATGAVGVVFSLMAIIQAIGFFFGQGSGNFISREIGHKNYQEASEMASTGFFSALATGILICVLGLLFLEPLAYLLGSTDTILPYTKAYLSVILLGAPWMTSSLVLNNQLRFQGSAAYAMVGITSGGLLNIVLDPIFIFGLGPMPELGIRGAAWATGIGQTASLLFYLILNHVKPLNVEISLREMRPSKEICGGMYSVGIAATLNMALTSLLLTALNAILAPFSQVYILVLGVYYKLQALLYQGASGVVQGMRPLIGYNYGAGEQERVKKIFRAAFMIVGIIMTAGTLLGELVPDFLMGLFTQTPSTVEIGRTALRLISPGFVMSTVSVIASGAFEGLGMGLKSLKISLMRYAVIIIPIAFVLSRIIGPTGVWHAFWLAELITAVYAGASWKRTITVSL